MAWAAVVTGGRRFGMMIARPNCAAVCGTTVFSASPSRTCKCQSSGLVIVICSVMPPFSLKSEDELPDAEDAKITQRTQKEK